MGCGEAALAMVLVGLGVSAVSMTARALPDVATALASATFSDSRRLAQVGLRTESADRARNLVRGQLAVLDEVGL